MSRYLKVAWVLALSLGLLLVNTAKAETMDECAVRELEAGVAMVLSNQGFDAYAQLFHSGYSNWSGSGAPRAREKFLADVKAWHAGGAKAVAVSMQPLSFEVFGDVALSRYRLREDFNDGTSFVARFVSLAKRENGRWQLFRTHFDTVYDGPTDKAPSLCAA